MTGRFRLGHKTFFSAAWLGYRLGASGLMGIGLMLCAAAILWIASKRAEDSRVQPHSPHAVASIATPAMTPTPPIRLPSRGDIPLLLSRMERAAVEEGLGWPSADYQVAPADDAMPAQLNVRLSLEGSYVSVRRFVTKLLLDAPSLTLSEFSLTRPNTSVSTLTARLAIVVYLSSDPVDPAAGPIGNAGGPGASTR